MNISTEPRTSTSPATISEPERRAWYAAGAVLSVVAIGSTVIGLRWSPDHIENQQQTYAQPVTAIVVNDMAGGDVAVVSDSSNGSVRVERRLHWDNDEANPKPVVAEKLIDGTFTVSRNCPGGDDACSIDYVIHAPKSVSVTVRTTSGDLDVDGVTGVLNLSTTSGDIDATSISGNVTAITSSGEIKVDGVTGDLDLKTTSGDLDATSVEGNATGSTTSGDIKLTFTSPPNTVKAQATSGDIDVVLPKGFDYDITTTASGENDVDATVNPSAPRSITATATSGDISIV